MFGTRKKHNNKDNNNQPVKKQWQLELEDETNEAIPDNIEIPKNIYEDEEKEDQNNMKEENQDINEVNAFEVNQPSKSKEFDWMSSEDENNGIEETQEIQMNKENNNEITEGKEGILESEEAESDKKTIFISNIPLKASDEEILDKFRIYGNILNVEIPRNEGSRYNKGRAFIEYSSTREANNAIEERQFIGENQLHVTLGLHTATTTMAAAHKEMPFIYDEKTRRYIRAGEIEMTKKSESDESESESNSDSESGSESSSEDSQDSESDEGIIPKRKGKKDQSRSRSRSRSKSPKRSKFSKISKRN